MMCYVCRYSASARLLDGFHQPHRAERISLVWDNSYSYRRAKVVHLRAAAVSTEAYDAAVVSAEDSTRSAIWAMLADAARARNPRPPEEEEGKEGDASSRPSVQGPSTPTTPRDQMPRSPAPNDSGTAPSDSFWSYLFASSDAVAGSASTMACKLCGNRFGYFRRSHRCRACEGSFCLPCSRHHVELNGKTVSLLHDA
jgi:hypothetical protein